MRKQIPFDESGGVQVRSVEGGYVAEGPGFYVWDEDRNEVLRAVREFSRGGSEIPPTRRMLRVRPEMNVPVR